MKRTQISRSPKSSAAKLKKNTWDICSMYVRLRDAVNTTGGIDACKCVTCGREKPLFVRGGIEAGHFIAGRHNSILYDTRHIHGQCHYCNNHLKGNWVPYYEYMVKTYGEEFIEELKQRDRESKQWKPYELEELQDIFLRQIAEIIKPFDVLPDSVEVKLKPFRKRMNRLMIGDEVR